MLYILYKSARILWQLKVPIVPRIFVHVIRLLYGSFIPYTSAIGKNARFIYGGIGVLIHPRAIIGDNCTISPGVSIGGRSGHHEVPVLGNNVFVSAGAKVLGPVKIGDNVFIDANAVVIHDVPANRAVGGVPARVIERNLLEYGAAAAD